MKSIIYIGVALVIYFGIYYFFCSPKYELAYYYASSSNSYYLKLSNKDFYHFSGFNGDLDFVMLDKPIITNWVSMYDDSLELMGLSSFGEVRLNTNKTMATINLKGFHACNGIHKISPNKKTYDTYTSSFIDSCVEFIVLASAFLPVLIMILYVSLLRKKSIMERSAEAILFNLNLMSILAAIMIISALLENFSDYWRNSNLFYSLVKLLFASPLGYYTFLVVVLPWVYIIPGIILAFLSKFNPDSRKNLCIKIIISIYAILLGLILQFLVDPYQYFINLM